MFRCKALLHRSALPKTFRPRSGASDDPLRAVRRPSAPVDCGGNATALAWTACRAPARPGTPQGKRRPSRRSPKRAGRVVQDGWGAFCPGRGRGRRFQDNRKGGRARLGIATQGRARRCRSFAFRHCRMHRRRHYNCRPRVPVGSPAPMPGLDRDRGGRMSIAHRTLMNHRPNARAHGLYRSRPACRSPNPGRRSDPHYDAEPAGCRRFQGSFNGSNRAPACPGPER